MAKESLSRVVQGDCGLRHLLDEAKLRRTHDMSKEVEITEEDYRREVAETRARLATLRPPQEMEANELLNAGEYLETLGPVWQAATPRGRKEIYQLVLEVVPKGAFAPLFGGKGLS